jgi:RNA 3'-terminal phosphate cyclase (ATP)
MVEIDGSYGEGGGQVLRTALSLSCITGRPLRLFNIRKRRKKPGLMHQHLTCVNAMSEISNAEVKGNDIGSSELIFIPGKVNPGNYRFDIKTAGSTSLVIQSLLPPLILARGSSHITIKGGTHAPFCPPYHYISDVFIPMLGRIGINIMPSIKRYGFFPKGGGEVSLKIIPAERIRGLRLLSRGRLLSIYGYSGVSKLPVSIAGRQKGAVIKRLSPIPAEIQILDVSSIGEGTFVFLRAEYENSSAGFSSLGKKGKPAEVVGREAADEFLGFNDTSASLDPHLTDQIVLYLGLSGENSEFTTSRITQHLLTNLWVIGKFLKVRCEVEGETDSPGTVRLIF